MLQDLFQLAEDMGMTDKMRSIALGQGQGTIAAAMIEKVIQVCLRAAAICVGFLHEREKFSRKMITVGARKRWGVWRSSFAH